MKLKVKKLFEDAHLPEQMTKGAGAYDVYCHSITKENDNLYTCNLGIAMTPEEGYRICLIPRSGHSKYNWVLANSFGLGDSDYTGEYKVKFRAIPDSVGYYEPFPYVPGNRVAQMFVEKVIDIDIEGVNELDTTERGNGGFGSTGNNGSIEEARTHVPDSIKNRVFWEDSWNDESNSYA